MIQAHKIDNNGFIVDTLVVDDSFVNTDDVIVTRCPDGYFKAQYIRDTDTWIDARPQADALADAQNTAIQQLATLRDNAIFSTFTSNCTGTTYTYTADDRARTRYSYMATKAYNDTTYTGESIYTHEAGFINHTPQQIIQLANDEATHERNMWTQYSQLAGQVRAATTPQDALNVVAQWKG